jgi:hypothetical protein
VTELGHLRRINGIDGVSGSPPIAPNLGRCEAPFFAKTTGRAASRFDTDLNCYEERRSN